MSAVYVLWRLCAGHFRVRRGPGVRSSTPAYSRHPSCGSDCGGSPYSRSNRMKKVSPNPPPSTSDDTRQTQPETIFTLRPGLSTEAALSNASEMLESATVCAYDCAEHLDGSGRKQVLAVVQMIEIAQLLVDEALNRECPVA